MSRYGDHRDLHVLTHSFPTRRASDLRCPVDVDDARDLHRLVVDPDRAARSQHGDRPALVLGASRYHEDVGEVRLLGRQACEEVAETIAQDLLPLPESEAAEVALLGEDVDEAAAAAQPGRALAGPHPSPEERRWGKGCG